MRRKLIDCVFIVIMLGLALYAYHLLTDHSSAIEITFGKKGLTSLKQDDQELLLDGAFFIKKVVFRRPDGTTKISDGNNGSVNVDQARQRITSTYPWGMVSCLYAVKGGNLNLTIDVKNSSRDILSGISMELMDFSLPQQPKGWVPGYRYFSNNIGDPSIQYADFGSGAFALCNEDVGGKPLVIGFRYGGDYRDLPLTLSSANLSNMNYRWDPYIVRPIPPNGSDTYHISLRFGREGSTVADLAGDINQKFAAAHPFKLHWDDHRSIAMIHICTSQKHPDKNPRGWFLNDRSVDVTTPNGRADFKDRVMKYADTCIPIIKDMNAQGMIAWDMEGQQFPHATSYIGDPTIIGQMAPEMDQVADEYFKKFRDAGLRVGVCLRPQHLVHNGTLTAEQTEVADPAANLINKAAYAKKRWGCTLFYVDSNGDTNVPYPASIFAKLADAFPDCLFMPEHQNTEYYSITAPYETLVKGVTTPDSVRSVYPKAFEVLFVTDGDQDKRHDELVNAVKHGEILMFHGWWNNPNNVKTKEILKEGGG